ncbi:MAG: hypothetical protein M1818_001211 [Claussenomyces sp. TS43310]|nr:MAG: hypothetical protein M1818_001211 [Claussenomyces sp. TS43310]
MRLSSISAPLLLALLSSARLVLADVSTIITTATVSSAVAAPPAPTSTQYTSDSDFQTAMLTGQNFYRTEHNATALTWNTSSATYAATWAQKCAFKHSAGPTGENLAAGYPNATAAIDAWGQERDQYDFKSGDFSESTGHFTQIVWKSTTSVGCGRFACNGNDATPGWYTVCEYYPPGNVLGAFTANVQAQTMGPAHGDIETGLQKQGGAAGGPASVHPWCRFLMIATALGLATTL